MKADTLPGDDSDWCQGRVVSVTNESHIDNNSLYTHHCNILALLNHHVINYSST